MGLVRVIQHNLTKNRKRVLREFDNFMLAAKYGRKLESYLKATEEGYKEALGFASICYVTHNGNEYQFYYELTELWK